MSKVIKFHLYGSPQCPYCVMVKGSIMMYLNSTASGVYNRYVQEYQRGIPSHDELWNDQIADVVPSSHTTIPCIVAEYEDGSLKFVGGLDGFVRKFSRKSRSRP